MVDLAGLLRLVPERYRPEIRRGPGSLYRRWVSLRFLAGRDRQAAIDFLLLHPPPIPLSERAALIRAFVTITNHVRAYHTQAEMLRVAAAILRRRAPVTVVEAGAGKGASTAKLSLAVRAAGGGTLHVFDSFRGLPENDEVHQNLDGRTVRFRKGAFTGRLGSVRRTVETWGAPEVCVFHRGWFEDTLPEFDAPVDVALLDVDLWSSTATCLRHLFPRLRPGGVLFSQDGHLRTIADRLADPEFWRAEVGVAPPRIRGLGHEKLLVIPSSAGL
jgi:O-methyltransferase